VWALATIFVLLIIASAYRAAWAQTSRPDSQKVTQPNSFFGHAQKNGIGSGSVAIVGDTLMIEGTPADDRILVRATRRSDMVRVVFNGQNLGAYGPIAKILVDAGDGNDTVFVDPEVKLPAALHGGPGNDHLRGGSGPDLVFGEDGNDLLIGSPGRDALDTGPGQNRVIVREPMGTIQVGPSAAGDVLRILSEAYTLRPLGGEQRALRRNGSKLEPGPIVIGGADLRDKAIVDLLQTSYEAGNAIVLASASTDDAELLRNLLGHNSGGEWDASIQQTDLVAFRRAIRPDGQTHESTSVLLPRQGKLVGDKRKADDNAIEWLSQVFSGRPIVPGLAPGDDGTCQNVLPTECLQSLANSYQSKIRVEGSIGDAVQIVNTVWGARSFNNQLDLYYILQETDYSGPISAGGTATGANNSLVQPGVAPTTIQPSPQTTGETTTITSGLSSSFGGNLGYNQMQGFNATASAGLTVSDSTTFTVPPLIVTYNGNLNTGETVWDSIVLGFNGTTTITLFNQWIWEVPFTAYSTTQQNIMFTSESELGILTNSLTAKLNSTVPLPFGDTFALQQPVVTSVSPTSVFEGDEFTITGTGLYPSLVTGVLINGEPLDPTQFSTVSDTEITVVAPDTLGFFLPVVVQTSQGVSNDNVTIEIIGLPGSAPGTGNQSTRKRVHRKMSGP
jgi:hypothetical protein